MRQAWGQWLVSRGSAFGQAQNDAATGTAQPNQKAASADSRLPDGTEYVSWEQPLKFSKTYYVDNNSAKADDNGPGTAQRPFRTINKAAQVLQPGERVVIASGTYRECVRPVRGGTGPAQMISYEAAPGGKVFVKGSEILKDGWQQESIPVGFRAAEAKPAKLQARSPHGSTNSRHDVPRCLQPFALASVMGQWEWLDTKSVDMGPYFRRRGLVFVDGKPLEPMEQLRELAMRASAARPPISRFHPRLKTACLLAPRRTDHAGSRRLAGSQVLGRRLGNRDSHPPGLGHARRAPDRSHHPSTRLRPRAKRSWLHPASRESPSSTPATRYPFPQCGMVSIAGGDHWIIEDNTIEWANGVGLDIGNGDGMAVPRRKPGHRRSSARNTIPLLRRRRHRRHGNTRTPSSKTISSSGAAGRTPNAHGKPPQPSSTAPKTCSSAAT